MECIKKLHETVEILEILWAKCLNCLKNLMQILQRCLLRPDIIRTSPSLFFASMHRASMHDLHRSTR